MRSSVRELSGSCGRTGKPIAQVARDLGIVARDLGINEGTLGNWIARDKVERGDTPLSSNGPRCYPRRERSRRAFRRLIPKDVDR
jgi:transposase